MADEIKNEDTNEVFPTTTPEEVSGESLTKAEDKEQEGVAYPEEEEKVSEITTAEEEVEEPSKEVDPDAEYDYHKRG